MIPPVVPPDQRARQAVDSLKGYAFQLYMSVSEWMRLEPEATLILEVAEDYAVLARSSMTMTQVKADVGTITLRSPGVAKALTSLWQFQSANPGIQVRLVYLTTSTAGREQGAGFAEADGGIGYWRKASQDAATEPLRSLLAKLPLPTDLLDFVRDADDESLRKRLLGPVDWACGAPSLDAVRERLISDLVAVAAGRELLASDGADALPALVEHVLLTIIAGQRRLTRNDFELAFEKAVSIRVSKAVARKLMTDCGAGQDRWPLRMAPQAPNVLVARPALIAEAIERVCRDDALALIGIGGSGKSGLAAVLASETKVWERFPDGVVWATLGREADLAGHLAAWIMAAGQTPPITSDVDVLAAIWRGVVQARRILVVADDLWRLEQLSRLRPPAGCGFVVTSRSLGVASAMSIEALEVGAMEPEEALELVGRVAGVDLQGRDQVDAIVFCGSIGRLPLPLVLGASLVREGSSFALLATELKDEELRLSALDLDLGMSNDTPSDDRRMVSMEACLGVSVRALDELHRCAFYRLAVLPEATVFDAETIGTILAVPDIRSASRLLNTLARRGLLTRVQDQVFCVYRIHDLLLDYARTAFGTGRARVASVPNVLPREMRDMHGELLDRLIADSPTGAWADIDEALHFGTYLGWHMVMAGRPELLHILIMEADATGAPAWLMRARRHGQTSDFLGDLARAIGVASADIAHARTDAERAESTARVAACCAVFTTIAARASAIPVGLLPRMVRLHRISSSEALTSANLVAGGLGCWMLAELLPLIPAGVRRETWSSLFAKALYGYEFAMIGDAEFLSVLLPVLEPSEWSELLVRLRELPAIVQARVLAAMQPWRSVRTNEELARFLADGSDAAGRSAGIVHLAACGVDTSRDWAQLAGLANSCGGFAREAKCIFLLMPDTELAAIIRGMPADRLFQIIEPFERFDRPLPLVALHDAILVAEGEPDHAARAMLMARLCERCGDQRPERLFKFTLALLLAMDDGDWRKSDSLGRVIPFLTGSEKGQAEHGFVQAGAAIGFGALGAMRLRAIASKLDMNTIEAILGALASGSAFDRQVTLPALLEFAADEDLAWRITEAIIDEAATTGRIGDVHHAADRIPDEQLSILLDAARQLPCPEFIEAMLSLSVSLRELPSSLVDWVTDSWPHLAADNRLIIAGLSAAEIGYASVEAALKDVSACLFGTDHPLNSATAALEVGPAVLARFSEPAVCDAAVGLIGSKLGSLPDYRLTEAARLSKYLTEPQVRGLTSRVFLGEDPGRDAYALEALAVTVPGESSRLLARAAEILSDAGDIQNAAKWVVRVGARLDGSTARPLLALLERTTEQVDRLMLSTALFRFLPTGIQDALTDELVHSKLLTPAFVGLLDLDAYPPAVQTALDLCSMSGVASDPNFGRSILANASRLVETDTRLAEVLLGSLGSHNLSLNLIELLASSITLGLSGFGKVLSRAAPALRTTFGAEACPALARSISNATVLYANSSAVSRREA